MEIIQHSVVALVTIALAAYRNGKKEKKKQMLKINKRGNRSLYIK